MLDERVFETCVVSRRAHDRAHDLAKPVVGQAYGRAVDNVVVAH